MSNFRILLTINSFPQLESSNATRNEPKQMPSLDLRYVYPRASYVISAMNDTFQRNDDDKNFNEVLIVRQKETIRLATREIEEHRAWLNEAPFPATGDWHAFFLQII